MNNTSTLIIVILAMAVLLLMFLRTRKSGVKHTLTPRRMAEQEAEEEERNAPPEPQWRLGDLGTGGKIHLSLPKGLEEDYVVARRDRIVWPDEQIEYDIGLVGDDPNHHVWIHWWTIGVHTYAWMLEGDEYTLEDLGLTPATLEKMRAEGKGAFAFRDQTYALDNARALRIYEGGLRPGKDVVRWDFRNDSDTRRIVIERPARDGESYHVLVGKELWLRDLTIIRPRAEPANEPRPDAPPERPNRAQESG